MTFQLSHKQESTYIRLVNIHVKWLSDKIINTKMLNYDSDFKCMTGM